MASSMQMFGLHGVKWNVKLIFSESSQQVLSEYAILSILDKYF